MRQRELNLVISWFALRDMDMIRLNEDGTFTRIPVPLT
jgi:hypothetical protein